MHGSHAWSLFSPHAEFLAVGKRQVKQDAAMCLTLHQRHCGKRLTTRPQTYCLVSFLISTSQLQISPSTCSKKDFIISVLHFPAFCQALVHVLLILLLTVTITVIKRESCLQMLHFIVLYVPCLSIKSHYESYLFPDGQYVVCFTTHFNFIY